MWIEPSASMWYGDFSRWGKLALFVVRTVSSINELAFDDEIESLRCTIGETISRPTPFGDAGLENSKEDIHAFCVSKPIGMPNDYLLSLFDGGRTHNRVHDSR